MKNQNASALVLLLISAIASGELTMQAQSKYAITDLGATLGPKSFAQAINNRGEVAGYWDTVTNGVHAFLYSQGAFTDLGALGGTNRYALNINIFAQVVGFAQTEDGMRAFLFSGGTMRNVGGFWSGNSYAFGINGSGQIVGHVETAEGARAFLLEGDTVTWLGTLGGTNSFAFGINSMRQIAGASQSGEEKMQAFLWNNGTLMNLNALIPAASGWDLRDARGINDFGAIVGWGVINGEEHAFLYSGGVVNDLGALHIAQSSYALGLNNKNDVVGGGSLPNGSRHAFIWQGGTIKDLNDLIVPESGWQLREALGINDFGQVVGWGVFRGEDRAFLLNAGAEVQSQSAKPVAVVPSTSLAVAQQQSSPNGGFGIESFGSGPVTNSPLADAHVRDGTFATTNFGANTVMELQTSATSGSSRDLYFKFDISNAPSPIGSAKLRVFASLSGNGSVITTAFSVSDTNWTETGINWNNRPTLGTALSNQTFNVKAGASYDINITSFAQSEQNAGRSIITVALHCTNNTTLLASINSKENSANKPVLVLNTNTFPTISISSPTNNASFPAPTNLTISATASDADGSITNVEFYAGNFLIGRDTTSPYSVVWTNAPIGTFALTARATDNLGAMSTSAVVNITITTNLIAIADAHVVSTNVTKNFGTNMVLEVQTNGVAGPNRDTHVRFDLSSVTNISNAKLRIFAGLSASGTYTTWAYSVANTNWGETSVTWSNRPPLSNSLNSVTISGTTLAWYTIDVTSFIRSEKSAGRNLVCLGVHCQTNSASLIKINSREANSNKVELLIAVTNAPPSVTVTNPANNAVFASGAPISIGASAADSDLSVSQVEFFGGAVSIGVDSTSPYSATWNGAPAGTNAVTARATDNYGLITTSAVVNVIVDVPPSVSVTAPANNSVYSAPATITLSANASDSDGTVTQVEFFQGTSSLGVDSSSPYSITWSNVAAGSYALTARATDNLGLTTTSTAVNVTVELPPSVSLTSPVNGAVYVVPVDISLAATASDPDGTISQVELFQGTSSLGLRTSPPYSLTWSNVASGLYAVTARATDNLGVISTSSVANIVVDVAPSVTMTNPANNAIFPPGSNITLDASASDSDGTITKVEFFRSATNKLGETSVSPYSFVWTNVPLGRYSISAKATDNAGISTTSATIIVLADVPPTVTITNPPNNTSFSLPADISVSASASDSDGTVSRIDFYAGSIWIGTSQSIPYTIVWSNAVAGTFALTAVATDDLGGSSTSTAVYITNTFFPTNLSGVKLWLDAGAGVTTNSSAQVSLWADQTGNTNNATQVTSGNQPLLVTNALNGRPIVRFDAVNDYFSFPNNPFNAATQGEVFVILKAVAAPSSFRTLWSMGGNSTFYLSPYLWIQEIFGCTGSQNLGNPSQPVDQYHLYNVASTPAQWSARINGVLQYQTTNHTVSFPAPFVLGGPFEGDVAEIVAYNRGLSAAERDAVGRYLAGKYALVPGPTVPTNLTAKAIASNQVSVAWSAAITNTETTFVVERKQGAGGTYAMISAVDQSGSWIDTNVTAGTEYFYRVKASNYAGESDYSNETNATPIVGGVSMPLTALVLWLKADAGHGASNLNIWADQSGRGNHAIQANSVWRPQAVERVLNGRQVVRFNPAHTVFSFQNDPLRSAGEAEAFVVLKAKVDVPSTYRGFWRFGPNGSMYPHYSGDIYDDFGSSAMRLVGNPAQPLDQFHVYNVAATTNDWSARLNGVLQFSAVGNTPNFYPAPLLGLGNSDAAFDGDIAEVLIFNRPLVLDERDAVGRYLNDKYAFISSSPVTPSGLLVTGLSSSQLNISWTNTSAMVGVTYKVERKIGASGTYSQIGEVPNLQSFVDTQVLPGTNYYYRVKGANYYGESSYSAEISPPTITFTSPTNGNALTTTNLLINANAFDTDGTISQVQFFADTFLIATFSSSPYSMNWINPFPKSYSFTAKAWDNSGNMRIANVVNMIVALDSDSDGISDIDEIAQGTNPFLADTDGDGVPDGLDAFPLDPTRWLPPSPDPNDHTPPTIILDEPADATPVP